jgi:osmotically-inducible protein OsmY
MKRITIMFTGFCLCAALAGCGSNPAKTQRPDLLDDKVTAGRVEAALHRAGPDFDHVAVQANGGRVTLSGRVRTVQDKTRAEEIARSVKRVRELQNEIEEQP